MCVRHKYSKRIALVVGRIVFAFRDLCGFAQHPRKSNVRLPAAFSWVGEKDKELPTSAAKTGTLRAARFFSGLKLSSSSLSFTVSACGFPHSM
jgi:hypothetical protein